ncbi:hypothetical protein [Devosia sp. DBB001]|nr:hypothetical protein [Devosia sp. DBB001]
MPLLFVESHFHRRPKTQLSAPRRAPVSRDEVFVLRLVFPVSVNKFLHMALGN